MMSGQKVIGTSTIVYALLGFFAGLALSWFIGWISVPYLRSVAAIGWAFVIWGGLLLLAALWAVSLVPGMRTGMKGLPLSAFLWAFTLAVALVVIYALFNGLSSLGF